MNKSTKLEELVIELKKEKVQIKIFNFLDLKKTDFQRYENPILTLNF